VTTARILDCSLGNIVSVPFAIIDRMGRCKPVTAVVVDETHQQAWISRPRAVLVGAVVRSQPCLHPLPKLTRYDSFMLAGIDLALVLDFTKIDPVPEDFIQGTASLQLGEPLAQAGAAEPAGDVLDDRGGIWTCII